MKMIILNDDADDVDDADMWLYCSWYYTECLVVIIIVVHISDYDDVQQMRIRTMPCHVNGKFDRNTDLIRYSMIEH